MYTLVETAISVSGPKWKVVNTEAQMENIQEKKNVGGGRRICGVRGEIQEKENCFA